MKIKIISFDLDGTLVDKNFDNSIWFEEIPKLYASKNKISFRNAKKFVFSEYAKFEKSHNWTDIGFWFNHFKLKNWKKIINDLKKNIKPYSEVIPVLKKLKKKYKLIIVTQANMKFVKLKLKAEGLKKYFSYVFSTSSHFEQVNKTENIYKTILKKLKIKPCEIIHIGDNKRLDYIIPRKLGITSFLVKRSYKGKNKNILKNLKDLEKVL